MSRNPFLNALAAVAYIGLIVATFSAARMLDEHSIGLIIPFAFLSLFVFSAALMGYLFLSHPIQLLILGKADVAIRLFVLTMLEFAAIVLVVLVVWFLIA